MQKTIFLFIAFVMLIGFIAPSNTVYANQSDWETAMNRSLDWLRYEISPNPIVGSVGGEWAVLALARANRVTADDPWVIGWLSDLDSVLAEVNRTLADYDIHNPPSVGTFPGELRRWTDFQRVTLALSALGLDASNHNERDLTEIYSTFVPSAQRHALNQTINVDTFALIALDATQKDGDRDAFIESLIDGQRPDGTWSLSPSLPSSSFDLDITAMALQALAPYYYQGDARVTNAVNTALGWLRVQTFPDSESTAQMIVALTALGPDFAYEAAYYVDLLLTWFDPASGGFRRETSEGYANHMATEQAAYALVSYWRFVNNMNPLYDMRDAFEIQSGQAAQTPIGRGKIAEMLEWARLI